MLRFANYSLFLKYENCDSVKNLSFEFNLLLLCSIKFGYLFLSHKWDQIEILISNRES